MGAFLKILSFLATLFTFIRERQLINRGREELQKDVDEANRKAQELADKQVAEANAIRSDSNISDDFLQPPSERNNR